MQTNYLVQISVGPVQTFIATARRTRDLWFGSYLLSELGKAMAKSLHCNGAELIFPSVAEPEKDLTAGSEALIVNIVLAALNGKTKEEAQDIANKAAVAANTRWVDLCKQAWCEADDTAKRFKFDDANVLIRKDVWDAQMADTIVVDWACAPWHKNTEYKSAYDAVRTAHAMRKNMNFPDQLKDVGWALPKSSLDGVRNTVFTEAAANSQSAQRFKQALGIEAKEQLDVAGFVKRVAGRQRKFLPVSRIAADSWLESLKDVDGAPAHNLTKLLSKAMNDVAVNSDDQSIRLSEATIKDYPWAKDFAFDAQLLYPERLNMAVGAAAKSGSDQQKLKVALEQLRGAEKPGTPCPYYALLLADGDKMGDLINAAAVSANPEQTHRLVSRQLAEFASAVPELVAVHHGVCVYAGGDDVMALVRIDKAVACALELSKAFNKQMFLAVTEVNKCAKSPGATPLNVSVPTLSVGVAVAHIFEPLGNVRMMAAKAEHFAKNGPPGTPANQQRNAICVMVTPRSGSENKTRIRWDDSDSLGLLTNWQAAFLDELPRGLPYELQQRYDAIAGVFDRDSQDIVANSHTEQSLADLLWQAELATVLSKKRRIDGRDLSEKICTGVKDALKTDTANRLELMRIARWLCAKDLELTR